MKRLLRALGFWLIGCCLCVSAFAGFTVYNLAAISMQA